VFHICIFKQRIPVITGIISDLLNQLKSEQFGSESVDESLNVFDSKNVVYEMGVPLGKGKRVKFTLETAIEA
jgi:hypothetical protein